MKFDKILICGCSFSSGLGMPGERSDKNNWPNLLANKLDTNSVTNVARSGSNNYWIFLETMSSMLRDNYDLVLVQWSAIPRYRFPVGLSLSYNETSFRSDAIMTDNKIIKKQRLIEIKNTLLQLHNDHWDMLDLVKYVNILIEMQVNLRKSKIFFVNGLGPWSDQYFVKKQIKHPSDLDSFTQNLLQVESRDDEEIFKLYNMIHKHYADHGGIQEQYWLNLYQPMNQLQIDRIEPNDPHPGLKSQQIFADLFANQITLK
jgi:hypothetical protein